jgi:hypothetical protein
MIANDHLSLLYLPNVYPYNYQLPTLISYFLQLREGLVKSILTLLLSLLSAIATHLYSSSSRHSILKIIFFFSLSFVCSFVFRRASSTLTLISFKSTHLFPFFSFSIFLYFLYSCILIHFIINYSLIFLP